MEAIQAVNFWDNHNYAFLQLLMWVFFPRLSFWFMSVITGGFWFWVGVFFVPHIMVAFWATTMYWDTNPVLCVIAWIIALGGTSTETKTCNIQVNKRGRYRHIY